MHSKLKNNNVKNLYQFKACAEANEKKNSKVLLLSTFVKNNQNRNSFSLKPFIH
jgi:hypothetical protein